MSTVHDAVAAQAQGDADFLGRLADELVPTIKRRIRALAGTGARVPGG